MQEVEVENRSLRKRETMKRKNSKVLLAALLALFVGGVVTAQYDDIYFDPDNADEAYAAVELEKFYDEDDREVRSVEDDYDYYYSSRIRRFDRSYYGFDFYSPVYVDPFYYNPAFAGFYRPGSSIYWGGAYAAPVYSRNVWVNSSFGWGAPVSYGVFNTWGPVYGAPIGGGFVNPGFYGGAGFPVANGFSGASFGGFGGGGFAGGGFNAYCPPAVGSIYGNPASGVFRPGNQGTVVGGSGSTRSGSATSSGGTVYGPRGGAGAVTGSPRAINNNRGGTVTGPDRPLTTGTTTTQSPRAGQRTTATAPSRVSSSTVGGSPRQSAAYTPPAWISKQNASRSSRSSGVSSRSNASSRYSATPPSRPSRSSYSPSSSSSRSSWNSPRSSSSSRSNFSSPSSSSSRSSFSSPRSSGGSSRSSSGGASRSSGGRGGR